MPILAVVDIISQIFFAVHAGKTGRYSWIFIILVFPVIGPLIYFFVEFLPEYQASSKIKKARVIKPSTNIPRLKQELEILDSVKNRVNLAEAYFQTGHFEKAISLLEKSLTGIYKNDPIILEGLSYTSFAKGDYAAAMEYLTRLENTEDCSHPSQLKLMKARVYDELGDKAAARDLYESIFRSFPGEEARYRYALLLKKNGEKDKSNALFQEILKNAKLFPKEYKQFQSKWVRMARSEMTK